MNLIAPASDSSSFSLTHTAKNNSFTYSLKVHLLLDSWLWKIQATQQRHLILMITREKKETNCFTCTLFTLTLSVCVQVMILFIFPLLLPLQLLPLRLITTLCPSDQPWWAKEREREHSLFAFSFFFFFSKNALVILSLCLFMRCNYCEETDAFFSFCMHFLLYSLLPMAALEHIDRYVRMCVCVVQVRTLSTASTQQDPVRTDVINFRVESTERWRREDQYIHPMVLFDSLVHGYWCAFFLLSSSLSSPFSFLLYSRRTLSLSTTALLVLSRVLSQVNSLHSIVRWNEFIAFTLVSSLSPLSLLSPSFELIRLINKCLTK